MISQKIKRKYTPTTEGNNSENGYRFEALVKKELDKANFNFKKNYQLPGIHCGKRNPKNDLTGRLLDGRYVVLELKTSIRERIDIIQYRAMCIKKVYPDALCYFISMHKKEIKNAKKNYSAYDPEVNSFLDGIIYGGGIELDKLLNSLKLDPTF